MEGEETAVLAEVGDQGAGDGGFEAGDDSADSSAAGAVTLEGDTEGGEGGSDATDSPDASAEGDGRKVRKEIRDHIAEVRKTNPTLAKELQRQYFKLETIDKLGTTQELTAAKEALELVGGPDGITAMAEEVESARQLEQGFERGDPAVIEVWAKEHPDGFKKLILPAFDKLAQMDPAAYEQKAAAVAGKLFDSYGVFRAWEQIGSALAAGKTENAVKLYNELTSNILNPLRSAGQRSAAAPQDDRSKELDQREQELTENAAKQFRADVRRDVNTQVTAQMNAAIRTMTNGRAIASGTGNRVRSEINAELQRLVLSDPNYQRQYNAIMAAGDRDRAIKFITAAANKRLTTAVKSVLGDFNLLGGTRTAKPTGAKPGVVRESGPVKATAVSARPGLGDFDLTRTSREYLITHKTHGQGWLKSGKQVSW